MIYTERPPGGYFAHQAAKYSFYAPLIVILLSCLTNPIRNDMPGYAILIGLFVVLVLLSAFVLAIVGLVGIKRHGRRGILGYAIAGLIINSLLLVGFAAGFQAAKRVASTRAPMTAAALENAPRYRPDSQVIIDATHGFRVEVPPEFTPVPPSPELSPHALAFARQRDDGTQWIMTIEPLGGIIGQEPATAELLAKVQGGFPPGAKVSWATFQWMRFSVDGLEIQLSDDLAGYAVQVPAIPQAIQLFIMGSPDDLQETRKHMDDLLQSFRANSNWKPTP